MKYVFPTGASGNKKISSVTENLTKLSVTDIPAKATSSSSSGRVVNTTTSSSSGMANAHEGTVAGAETTTTTVPADTIKSSGDAPKSKKNKIKRRNELLIVDISISTNYQGSCSIF